MRGIFVQPNWGAPPGHNVAWASIHECTLSRISEEAARAASSALAVVDRADYSIGISKRAMMPGSPPLASSSGSGSRVATHAYPCSG
jgi:hypothetical protein